MESLPIARHGRICVCLRNRDLGAHPITIASELSPRTAPTATVQELNELLLIVQNQLALLLDLVDRPLERHQLIAMLPP